MNHFEIIMAAIVGTVASARVGRFIGFDTYPPIAWLRAKWDDHTSNSGWNKLVHCGYCSTPYIVAADGSWGYFTHGAHMQLAWWLANGFLAASYAAALVIAYDGDD